MVGKLYLQHGAAIWKLLYGGLAVDVASDLGEWERRAEEIVCKVMLSFVGKGRGVEAWESIFYLYILGRKACFLEDSPKNSRFMPNSSSLR